MVLAAPRRGYDRFMSKHRNWQGVRLRTISIGADPDADPRLVSLPAAWDDEAARALAALVPGQGEASLPSAAESLFLPVAEAGRRAGTDDGLVPALHRLLLLRRAAPAASWWAGEPAREPGYVINLAAFVEAGSGFDAESYAETVEQAATALALVAPSATSVAIRIADLYGMLARLGIAYDSDEARAVASCVAALLRHHADQAPARLGRLGKLYPADWPRPPQSLLPSLSRAARQAFNAKGESRFAASTAIAEAGPVEALLGVETGGIAPAFSPVREDGSLTQAAQVWLSARGITPEAALAAALLGENPFPPARMAAYAAMIDAVAPYLHQAPARPAMAPPPMGAAGLQELPPRRRGYTQKASVAGHKLYLRTGEYEDGRLGEIFVALNKESPAFRGLMDCFAIAVSIGLQHGVPLSRYTNAFIGAKFGPAGAVEGDASVPAAGSLVDYLFRNLAAAYLGESHDEPKTEPGEADAAHEPSPLLPLDLPQARRQNLKLVK